MYWKKLGKIFDPKRFRLPNGCLEFAQAPQALLMKDTIRIYFSTRFKEPSGKFLSYVAFVEYSKDFSTVMSVSDHAVMDLGELGCYDEHGIFPLNVLADGDKILGFIGGWNRRVSVSVDGAIGLAISHDQGVTFQRVGNGPILAPTLHEPYLIGDPFVLRINNLYHMWYIYGKRWIEPSSEEPEARVYKIAYAYSSNAIDWFRDGKQIIEDRLDENECQALPTVFHKDNMYHMIFCYRYSTGFRKDRTRGYRLGYASSHDGRHWLRNDSQCGITNGDTWDSDMMCYPHVTKCEDKYYLLYNGNEFGRGGFGLAVLE